MKEIKQFKERWGKLNASYMARSKRDRWLLPAALCFGALAMGYMFGIEPAAKEERELKQKLVQANSQLAGVNAQLKVLRVRVQDPDADLRSQLNGVQSQTRNTDNQLKQLQGALVPAQEMSQWLSGLLQSQHGLQLVGLKSLPATSVGDLVAKAAPPASAASDASAAPTQAATANEAWLYRHGVEISVRGNYRDLLAYLKSLETMQRRVYWGELNIAAQDDASALMTLKVYTVSLEKSWWVI